MTNWRSSAAVLAVVAVACATGSVLPSQETPVVEPIGEGVVRYGGQDIWVIVDYDFGRQSTGERWLLLDVGVTAANGRKAKVLRDNVFVRSPAGHRYPLAKQAEITENHMELANLIRRADVARSNPFNFPRSRQPCRFDFFVAQGDRRRVAFDEVFINDRRVCFERFYFNVPEGIDAGRWMLGIDLEHSEARVPFDLGVHDSVPRREPTG